jgi:uncharacterized SAM-binding protein YcdF (DUF218 family)
MNTLLSAGLALFFWLLLIISMVIDLRRLHNSFLLLTAILATFPLLISLGGDSQGLVASILFLVLFLLALIMPVYLIVDGIIMLRKESHRFHNMLSLLFGILLILGEAATAVFAVRMSSLNYIDEHGHLVREVNHTLLYVLGAFSVTVLFSAMVFLAFMLYSLLIQILPKGRSFDYVIIHGAGLLHGDKVSKLLQDRCDKAVSVYRKAKKPPYLIPSGGMGKDEKISEAEAMTAYLLTQDIPREKILPEDQSRNTYENLKFSMALIEAREGRKNTALVTSNYHVYRCLRYCRKLGINCTGIGAPVARYYWPTALIREFFAVMREKRNAFLLVLCWLFCLLAVFLLILYMTA